MGSGARPSENNPHMWQVIKVKQNMAQTASLIIKEPSSEHITISGAELYTYSSGYASSSSYVSSTSSLNSDIPYDVGEDAYVAKLYMMEHPSSNTIVMVDGLYKGNGLFEFNFTVPNTPKSGLFIADIFIFNNSGEILYTEKVYVEIQYNVTDITNHYDPISIAEVRLVIRDTCAENNYLLDDIEYTDIEIWHAIRRPVDVWNETPPPVSYYTYSNFPFRANWVEATIGYLLKSAAHRYRRNDLQYSASGVTVADQAKYQQYDAAGNERIKLFLDWMRAVKVAQNIEGAFGAVIGRWTL
jgi:hypothetical protein